MGRCEKEELELFASQTDFATGKYEKETEEPTLPLKSIMWQPPSRHMIKVNWDTAVSKKNGCVGWGSLLEILWKSFQSARIPTSAIESDRLTLLDLKKRISEDPLQIMSSWNDSTHFCNWFGVTCNPSTKRVIILNLQAQRLAGTLTPSMGNLTYLTGIILGNNSFYGEIPQELGRLGRLQNLNLSRNSFGGNLPSNLSHCTQLRVLDANNLTGSIPTWIGNFSSLFVLSLIQNNLQGSIPSELGRLSGLGFFSLAMNNLSGTISPLIYNISSIYHFSVIQNQLHGSLPPDVGLTLPNLELFAGGVNSFTGPIPVSLSNASRLKELKFSYNDLTGTVPQNLASLQGLVKLNFFHNRLGNGKVGDLNFLDFLANCTSLKVLRLGYNQLGGVLPSSIANLSSQLNLLTLGGNIIHGGIPIGIGNLVNLTSLGLESNYLGGHLPNALGKLQQLRILGLNKNNFLGPIPFSLGNLTKLTILHMNTNRFEGSIPPSLGNCQNLLHLTLDSNNLNGTIPKEVIGLSSLSISLDMSHNFLTGTLPFEVSNLKNLANLDLSKNKLTGEIPTSLGSCTSLVSLHLEDNAFEGVIPTSLKTLRGLEEIDLSHNNLSGQIPEFLGKFLSLKHLNLSHNNLEGKVPSEWIFSNVSAISIFGNDKLCGGIPELLLPKCYTKSPRSFVKHLALKVVILLILVLALLCFFLTCCMVKKWRKRPLATSSLKDWRLASISYAELHASTNGFSVDNLIGSGSFGSVYKGVLSSNGAIVAVKVLNLQLRGASKSFINECNALRSLRHRNLCKIITACSSIDHQGNDFKSLVFEFMSNGSLDQWLHPIEDEQHRCKRLSFIQRLTIATDIAYALEYLHLHCHMPIVHCDVKPSNVLLNEDMVAHVGDFGLAKFVFEASHNLSKNQSMPDCLSSVLKGSFGYIPPEYGMGGQVSVLGDIYSYGVLLLEMFIGKRPTDDMFKDGLSIHMFTAMALPERVMDIVDSSMPLEEDEEAAHDETNNDGIEESAIIEEVDCHFNVKSRVEDYLVSVLQIGLLCSTTSPCERMPTNDVVSKLSAIRDAFLRFKNEIRLQFADYEQHMLKTSNVEEEGQYP
ncbi:probable LRR receptor-like serine/threonine-protein kinase At3g47570 [Corylus avellana]|uniref:probable LRR receptor-like serine/threonine-protein kinase At3g47570 n=1 Tax=Corylus avellana TaxID=13451 RepID=UPI00286B6114|nr:probable LRR receptor-like serine/threonine-protein kinase At3g47570 [Corylus avellana]